VDESRDARQDQGARRGLAADTDTMTNLRASGEAMPMTAGIHEAPCPQCGQAVSVTLATSETSDQLATERTRCPGCGAPLARAIEGHTDHGWRVEEESGG
jgi:predicted RNA-binding Zn-ribbon protein involved in translation (DUF1610 family)